MGVGLDPASAPGFMGPTPPNRVAMTYAEHAQALINQLASTNLSDDDLRITKVMFISVQQIIQQKLKQQGGQLLPEEEGPAPAGTDMGEGEDVQSAQGEPIDTEY